MAADVTRDAQAQEDWRQFVSPSNRLHGQKVSICPQCSRNGIFAKIPQHYDNGKAGTVIRQLGCQNMSPYGGTLCVFNSLTPNNHYSGRTAPLTSKGCILYIYSTNTGTEYFEHGIYSTFFFSSKCSLFHNSNVFGSCFIHILYTGCAKIKKKIIPAPKG